MCNKFITLLSLVSFISFSGLVAESKSLGKQTTKVAQAKPGQPAPCCFLETFVGLNPTSDCTLDGTIVANFIPEVSCDLPAINSIVFYLTSINTTTTIATPNFSVIFTGLSVGTYYVNAVALDANNNCVCITDCVQLVVGSNNGPEQCCSIQICASSTTICPGVSTQLAVFPTVPNGGIFDFDYTWYFSESGNPGTFCIAGSGPALTACMAGTYYATGRTSTQCATSCCVSTNTIVIKENLQTDFCICGNTSVCCGQTITLCATPITNPNDSFTYVWTDSNGNILSTTSTVSFTPSEPGTGFVCVTVTDTTTGCVNESCACFVVNAPYCVFTSDQCVSVGCPLNLTIDITPPNPDFECCGGSTPPACVQVIITGPGSFYLNENVPYGVNCFPVAYYSTEQNAGWYTVTVIDPHGCNQTARSRVIVIPACGQSSCPLPCPTTPCTPTTCPASGSCGVPVCQGPTK